MDWRRVDEYHMRSGFGKGNFYIAKAFVGGVARYSLWQRPLTLHGTYDSAAEAKQAALGLAAADADSERVGGAGRDCVGPDADVGSR
jgi:hypothetical protein